LLNPTHSAMNGYAGEASLSLPDFHLVTTGFSPILIHMKIGRVDSSNLIIKDAPLYPGIVWLPVSVFAFYKLAERLSSSMDPDKELFGILAAAVIPLIGVGLMNEFVRFHFNIGERTLSWKRTGLFGRKGGTVLFADIRKVVIETSSEHSRVSTTTYRLAVTTNDGNIPMTRYFKAGERYKKELESIAELIDGALGRDHKRFIEDSILELVATGRRIDAVRLVREHYRFGLTEAKRFIDELSSNQ